MLSKETLDMMHKIEAVYDSLSDLYSKLSDMVLKDTNGEFSCCTSVPSVSTQLYDYAEAHANGVMNSLERIADKGSIYTKWSDADQACYHFKVDGMETCIVVVNK